MNIDKVSLVKKMTFAVGRMTQYMLVLTLLFLNKVKRVAQKLRDVEKNEDTYSSKLKTN